MPAILDKIHDLFHRHENSGPTFDQKKVIVIYVLGGPGVGKGTQCANIVKDYGFKHLSAGDLLRAEQHREGSPYSELIQKHIREGTVVPMEVTVKLLENAMKETLDDKNVQTEPGNGWGDGKGRFLIDGFPRKMDQALKFDEEVCLSKYVLFFTCTEEVMLQRLLERGKTSGREDDNAESIKKRFVTFHEQSMPVVEYYRKQAKVLEVDSTKTVEQVYADVRVAIDKALTL